MIESERREELRDRPVTTPGKLTDPELMYVECGRCGRPVFWQEGRTTAVLMAAGVTMDALDQGCLLVSDGCVHCRPGVEDVQIHVLRMKDVPLADELRFEGGKGFGTA